MSPGRSAAKRWSVAIVGAGRLANFLAPALLSAGYRITEIAAREAVSSMMRARALARRVHARAVRLERAQFDADLIWIAVPDGEIGRAAEAVARRVASLPRTFSFSLRLAFHSSGVAGSGELEALRELGIATASVHPLMTFVAGARPSLAGVPFAIEGSPAAVRAARAMVRRLGAHSFVLATSRKAAYHAWATMTSPLLVAYLVAMEEAARAAGLTRTEARRMALPIVRQTFENYARLGPENAFSGPYVRGDAQTVAKHLELLQSDPKIRAVYVALARVALDGLPVKNRQKLLRLLVAAPQRLKAAPWGKALIAALPP